MTVIGIGIAGLVLLFLEMFLPGMIAGIAGGILLIVAVIMAYSEIGPEAGNAALVIAMLASAAMWWWWAKHFQHTRFGRMMTLESSGAGAAVAPGLADFIGQSGTALTPLRPGGTVLVAGKRVDAITDGEFIELDAAIVVVSAQGTGVVVRRVQA